MYPERGNKQQLCCKSARLVKSVYTTDLKSVPLSGYRFKSDSEQQIAIFDVRTRSCIATPGSYIILINHCIKS